MIGGNPGPVQTLPYPVPGVTTTASGTLEGSTIWSGRVLIVGDVTVRGSLTIQAGAEILFDPLHDAVAGGADKNRIELIIDGGALEVAGTEGQPVVFTSAAVNKERGQWSGIRVVNGDVRLRYFTVEHATTGLKFEDATTRFQTYVVEHGTLRFCNTGFQQSVGGDAVEPLTLSDMHAVRNGTGMDIAGSLTLDHCDSSNNESTGIYGAPAGGTLTLTSCSVTNNAGQGLVTSGKNLVLIDSEFRRNSGGAGVYCYNHSNYGSYRLEMRNCMVRENSSGIQLYQYFTEIIMVGNTISDHAGVGLEWQVFGGQLGAGGISGNTIRNNQIGMRVTGSAPSVMALSGNDIHANRELEIQNQGGIAVVADGNYWGEPTSTELVQNQANLSRIYDQRDNGSHGLVTVQNSRFSPLGSEVVTPPTITQNPQSRSVLAGSTVTFSVSANGTAPFNYFWRKNGNTISTDSILALFNVQVGEAGTYSVIVSNRAGTATSSSATLTVVSAPANLAVRTITKTGEVFSVSLVVSPPLGAGPGFVEELLPTGFIATMIDGRGLFDPIYGSILWGPLRENQTHTLAYTLAPPVDFRGSASLEGMAYFFGTGKAVIGDGEIRNGSDPRPRLTMTRVAGFFAVSIEAEVGRSYRIEAKDDLNVGSWVLQAVVPLSASPYLHFDTDSIGRTQRFYRCVLVE